MSNFRSNQNIETFYDRAQSRDFARDFLFRVHDIVLAGGVGLEPSELVYAKAASLPARNISNIQTPYMGLNFNIPGSVTYPGSEAFNLKFYLDANSELRNKMEAASRIVFDDSTSTGQYSTPTQEHYIHLQQLNKKLEPISDYMLYGASIRDIGAIEYQMATGTGTTVEMDVTMSYHFYKQTGAAQS
tara:strand:- start:4870 stop:5430 length:561 start_codon:yes stop_codon:yes gene_type:complete